MKIAIVFGILLAVVAVAFLALRRSRTQQVRDKAYAQLKALPPIVKDFTTPEGAILCLEDAYRRRDIEAAIAAKDFRTEARLMLQKTGFKDHIDDEMIVKTAEMLMESFRSHTTASWPDFEGLESFFHEARATRRQGCSRYRDVPFSRRRFFTAADACG